MRPCYIQKFIDLNNEHFMNELFKAYDKACSQDDLKYEFTKANKMPQNVRSIFIDTQICLMKSFVKENASWREFVEYMFLSYIEKKCQTCNVVVLLFDKYASVPLYKSIEQQCRTNTNKKFFKFETNQELPPLQSTQDVWVYALQNCMFKITVISIICNLIASNYKPKFDGKMLIIDCGPDNNAIGFFHLSMDSTSTCGVWVSLQTKAVLPADMQKKIERTHSTFCQEAQFFSISRSHMCAPVFVCLRVCVCACAPTLMPEYISRGIDWNASVCMHDEDSIDHLDIALPSDTDKIPCPCQSLARAPTAG